MQGNKKNAPKKEVRKETTNSFAQWSAKLRVNMHVEVLVDSNRLNGHTLRFYPQIRQFEPLLGTEY